MIVKTLTFQTSASKQIIDITEKVQNLVNQSSEKEGLCLVFVQHTTCSVMLGEYEAGLDEDFINMFEQLKPKGPFQHAHEPDHAPSHLFSSMVGEQVVIPIQGGQLAFGTWQKIMLVEFDGPRFRNVIVQIINSNR